MPLNLRPNSNDVATSLPDNYFSTNPSQLVKSQDTTEEWSTTSTVKIEAQVPRSRALGNRVPELKDRL
ncbi:uncharacterized protein BDV14DRAFT_163421 [Aspergillus stella-maris]|uniref:uncharacterized protein n=1 Tax=Aspergillus stella-maris TaxID=1810926 RepID=UPI003CCD2179